MAVKLANEAEFQWASAARAVLSARGFKMATEGECQDIHAHEDGRRVVLTNLRESIEAEVLDRRFKPDVRLVYDSEGLAALLDRGKE